MLTTTLLLTAITAIAFTTGILNLNLKDNKISVSIKTPQLQTNTPEQNVPELENKTWNQLNEFAQNTKTLILNQPWYVYALTVCTPLWIIGFLTARKRLKKDYPTEKTWERSEISDKFASVSLFFTAIIFAPLWTIIYLCAKLLQLVWKIMTLGVMSKKDDTPVKKEKRNYLYD